MRILKLPIQVAVLSLLCLPIINQAQSDPQAYEMSEEIRTFVSQTSAHKNKPVGYFLFKPLNQNGVYLFDNQAAPLIVSLHGLGYRSSGDFVSEATLNKAANSSSLRKGDAMATYISSAEEGGIGKGLNVPAVVISPQQPGKDINGNGVSDWNAPLIDEYIEDVKKRVNVDPNRIYLIGLSMGGGGIWKYLSNPSYGNKIAAAVPMAATRGTELASEAGEEGYQYTNIWAFHGYSDGRGVRVKNTIDMINAIDNARGNTSSTSVALKASIFETGMHGTLDDMILSSNGNPNDNTLLYNDKGNPEFALKDNSDLAITNTEYNVPVENAAVDDDPPGLPGVVQWLLNQTLVSPGASIPPSVLALSSTSIPENNLSGATIGTFSSNGSAPLYYELISTDAFPDNQAFSIVTSTLKANAVYDYERKNTYTIRVRVSNDEGGFERTFTITIEDTEEGVTNDIWLEAECGIVGSNWQIEQNTGSSNGKFVVYPAGKSLSNAPSSTADHILYSFEVSKTGSYYLSARISAPTAENNSLWVKIDNRNWIKWWEGIVVGQSFTWNAAPGGSIVLEAGTHTLSVAYRESGTQLDKLLLSPSDQLPSGTGLAAGNCDASPPPTSTNVWLEAECASSVGSAWQAKQNSQASGGEYVVYKGSSSMDQAPGGSKAELVYAIDLEQGGNYYLLARIQAPSNAENSVWVKIDEGAWIKWWEEITLGNSFHWNLAPGGAVSLSPGAHTLRVAYRESGTQLDKLLLSTESTLPEGTGPQASNCTSLPPSSQNGVAYRYYEDNTTSRVALPDFSTLVASKEGVLENFSLSPAEQPDYFLFSYTSYLEVAQAGQYTFFLTSDDGSRLWVNDQLVVDHDGPHGASEKAGSVTLGAGRHKVEVGYFDRLHNQVLQVAYQGPGISKQAIPDQVLFLPTNGAVARQLTNNTKKVSPTEHHRDKEWLIYPNPVDDQLTVDFGQSALGSTDVLLTDLSGRTVHRQNWQQASKISISTGRLPKGIYMVHVQQANRVLIKKVLIEH